jgi:peroxiredoxin
MPRVVRVLVVALLALAGLVRYLSRENRNLTERASTLRERTQYLHAGQPVPGFRAGTLEGDSVVVGSGRRRLLFLFNTRCSFCRASLPAWELSRRAVAEEHPAVQVLGVSLDSVAVARAYRDEHDLGFPIVTFPNRKLVRLARARLVPLVVLLDDEGYVTYSRLGVLEDPAAEDSVLAAVRTAAATSPPALAAPDEAPSPEPADSSTDGASPPAVARSLSSPEGGLR